MDSALMLAIAVCVFLLGYRFYSKFLSTKVAPLDGRAITPAAQMKDGRDYLPMTRTSVFFYHYATIAGSGVLIGPTLAAQYGWLPCIVWILTATCLAGGVHDFVVMLASVRNEGKSIGQIAFNEVGRVTGGAVTIVILFMIVTAISGLCLGTVVALEHNPWAVFTVICTIPIALVIGVVLSRRPAAIPAASCIGIVLLLAALFLGFHLYSAGLIGFLDLTRQELTIMVAVYAFVASMLPVHVLLQPRDYLSAYLKVGVIVMLVLGIFLVHPTFKMPAVTQYIGGGGPVVAGALWPFLFITITCGAISGWHTLCCSGVSPKLIRSEMDIRPIAYGGWLLESLAAVVALALASSLVASDYFAINATPTVFATLGMSPSELPQLSHLIGFELQGKTGGVTSLAVSMTKMFSSILGGEASMAVWYVFSIVFLGVFTMPIVDHGTRMARYLIQEAFTMVKIPLNLFTKSSGAALMTVAWTYLLYTGEIGVLWPMFGICNQLLACIGLAVGTAYVAKRRPKYAIVTYWPIILFASASIHGALLQLMRLLPKGGEAHVQAAMLLIMTSLFLVILVDSTRRWIGIFKKQTNTLRQARPL